jgi:hypothetical protein
VVIRPRFPQISASPAAIAPSSIRHPQVPLIHRTFQPAGPEARSRRIRRLANVGAVIVVLLLLSRCMYHDYGVPADDPAVRYPSRHHGAEDDPYQFYTDVYRADDPAGGSVEIEVQHLAREPYKRLYESRLTVRYGGPSRRLRVRPESVRLEHRTRGGRLLQPSETRSDFGACRTRTATAGCTETFRQLYRQPRSRRLRERVYLEYELDGRTHVIDATFPLEYRYHYSWWDVMLGI